MERLNELSELKNAVIDWEMTPEDAVTLYLEWATTPGGASIRESAQERLRHLFRGGHLGWRAEVAAHPPQLRGSRGAGRHRAARGHPAGIHRENGHAKGVAITDEIRHWLESRIYPISLDKQDRAAARELRSRAPARLFPLSSPGREG